MRNYNFMLTFYDENKYKITSLPENVVFFMGQEEECPSTGRIHFQAYVEMKSKVSFEQVKKIFNDQTLHVEERKGSQQQAMTYCSKSESRKQNGFSVKLGKPKNQGHRSDLDDMYDDLENGDSLKEILSNYRGNAMRHINAIRRTAIILHGLDHVDNYIITQRRIKESYDNKDSKGLLVALEAQAPHTAAILKNQ